MEPVMFWKRITSALAYLLILLLVCPSYAAHPLITDDTGTQGKGKFLLEINGQHDWDQEDVDGSSFTSTGGQAAAAMAYGISDQVDLIGNIPYLWFNLKENDTTMANEHGAGDATLEVKWRFFEKDKLSIALKLGVSIPTGNHEKELGAGHLGGHLFLVATQELGSWTFHGNLGYMLNENRMEERKDLWHASVAATWEAMKNLKLIANAGIERNPADGAADDPAFLIGGVIYTIREDVDIDVGVKYGLSKSETDLSLLAGIAYRF